VLAPDDGLEVLWYKLNSFVEHLTRDHKNTSMLRSHIHT